MITYTSGNILESTADVIVIPTNCQGVAGKGLAKAAADKWPNWNEQYHYRRSGYVAGQIYWFRMANGPSYICAMMTKKQWRNPSKLIWITSALDELREGLKGNIVATVAMPKVGCGLGGLDWTDVQREIDARLLHADFDTIVYI